MKKRSTAALLIAALTAGLLAGCGGNGNENGSTATESGSVSTEAASDYSKTLKISAWLYADDLEDSVMESYNDNPCIAYLSEKFNVEFDWQVPTAGSEGEGFNLMIGSGDYTDVFNDQYSSESHESLFEDGVIIDLASYVEQYCPNIYAYLNGTEEIKKTAYTDNGELLFIPISSRVSSNMWGGLVYNAEILNTMTADNVQFPSGNDVPTTVEDWDYMLPIMKEYLDATGLTDTACLIIPYTGYFSTGDLMTGFGTTGGYYVDAEGKVQYGLTNDNFYHYLVKMNQWYEAGYIYQDFASRSSDPFYLPNTALTYGGVAGVWYGLSSQLGDLMDIPDYGIDMNIVPVASPLDTANVSQEMDANLYMNMAYSAGVSNGWCITSSCSEENAIRWLQLCDYLYSEEGIMIKSYGLTAEQGEGDPVYEALGLTDGAYSIDENGNFAYNPLIDPNSTEVIANEHNLRIVRMPGLEDCTYMNALASDECNYADEIWTSCGYSECVPNGASLTVEESSVIAPLTTGVNDYINAMVPKFIMGTEALTPENYASYVETAMNMGLDQMLEIEQAAYDRYMAK